MGAPYDYTYINTVSGEVSPSTVHCANTNLTWYFRRYLIQKAISVFKWKLPKNWDKDFFRYALYCIGYLAIINTNKFGVIPTICTLGGYNVFYQPKWATISNPLFKQVYQLDIGEKCEIIKLQPDYGSIMDIVNYYADMLGLCAEAAGINVINSKLAFIAGAKSKAAAEALKKMFDTIQAGNPLVVYEKRDDLSDDDLFTLATRDLKANYIAPDILLTFRKIETDFLTKIGVPNTNTDKRERLTDDEVNANNVETQTLADMWLENINDSCARVAEMFPGIEISAEWRFKPNGSNAFNSGTVSV